jgi:prophage regulatory protein
MSSTTSTALLPLHDVTRITSLSKSTLYRLMDAKRFPQSVKISARRVGWKADEIEDFISNLSV